MSKVATTRIEKKYKDKKTGEYKTLVINYAKVADRLHEFREENPRSKISTNHKFDDNGNVIFKAYVWKDKSDFLEALKVTDAQTAMLSADSEGSAKSETDAEKDFEKLETIAVGRALALLGYAVNGDVASSEEMEAFEKYKLEKVESAIDAIQKAEKRGDFESILTSLSAEQQKQVTPIIKQRMEELKNAAATK